MDPASFTARRTGDLVPIVEGGFAFVPRPLPVGQSVLTPDVVLALSDAVAEVGRLDGLSAQLPQPEILIAPFLKKEAELSSRIEGTQTTFAEYVLFEAANEQNPGVDMREVSNYVTALRYALSRARDVTIGKTLLCEVQKLLLTGTNEESRSGTFRDQQVHIGPRGLSLGQARYVPPPAYHVSALFDNLERYMTIGERIPLLVRLAVIHYQFEAIHPFFDGNGRLGRLLMPLLIVKEAAMKAPILYLSAFFERRRAEYNDLMFMVSADGRWSEWITFFLRGVATQARDALARVTELNMLRSRYWAQASKARSAGALHQLIDRLFANPIISVTQAQRILGQSNQTSSTNVQKLVQYGIIQPYRVFGRSQFYVARDIMTVVDRVGTENLAPQLVEKHR
jgi:Fic family protein